MRAQRSPAEELAKRAAARRVAQVSERQEKARAAEGAAGGIWDALRQWLVLSDRAYQALIQRLTRGATAHPGSPASRMPLTREEDAEAGARFWWQRSRGLFDAMMRRLAEGAASPEGRQTRRAAPTTPEQGVDRRGADDPPVNAAAVATARVKRGGPVATGPGARDADKGAASADHAVGLPARVATAPPPRRRAAPPAAIAAGSDTAGHAAPMTVGQGHAQARGQQRTRPRGRARSASKPGYATWHGTRHRVGHGAGRGMGRMSAGARQHRLMRRVAAHRVHGCAAAGRRVALPGWYVVAKGDTLWRIARRHYGAGRAYLRIGKANRHRLRGRDRIVPCQRLYLPRASRRH